uniref:Uncharacterized protein n=1 Tax=Glossina palpalis gambiensis TaxID=67801 RepID=A0A1B0BD07_9MUSC
MLHTSLGAEKAVAAELVVFADEVAILCCNMHGEDYTPRISFCSRYDLNDYNSEDVMIRCYFSHISCFE